MLVLPPEAHGIRAVPDYAPVRCVPGYFHRLQRNEGEGIRRGQVTTGLLPVRRQYFPEQAYFPLPVGLAGLGALAQVALIIRQKTLRPPRYHTTQQQPPNDYQLLHEA
ncbi:hypothetical protein EJV47_08110 [Hymenobacter gummosus]|uniref:Uncharacterized protein n=1 Tax=Hymenobacter gummosus TaxID=1776032 RepID=A0A431U4G7_9BACT|nr:hypothetical protein EJV47_08110 [Hymenobacter gummosus]